MDQYCERPRWPRSYVPNCRALSPTPRATQHRACSQVFVCLYIWGRVGLFFLVVLVFSYTDEIKPDIYQCQTPSGPSGFFHCCISVQQDTGLDNNCTHWTFLPSTTCIPSHPIYWTCYCLVTLQKFRITVGTIQNKKPTSSPMTVKISL